MHVDCFYSSAGTHDFYKFVTAETDDFFFSIGVKDNKIITFKYSEFII